MMEEKVLDLFEELHDKKGSAWLEVLSGSMAPLLDVGDKVLVTKEPAETVKIGDIIVYRASGRLETHRALGVNKDDSERMFFQKGDNSKNAGYVSKGQYVGKVHKVKKDDKVIDLYKGLLRPLNRIIAINSHWMYRLRRFEGTWQGFLLYPFKGLRRILNNRIKRWNTQ